MRSGFRGRDSMRTNTLKQRLREGKAAFGVMITFPSPPVVEMLGCMGFDWILLDAEHAPNDAIIVTAAASHVPPPLVQQLKVGGRMVIPVGTSFLMQYLMLIEKQGDGSVTTRQVLPVAFVPLTGGH